MFSSFAKVPYLVILNLKSYLILILDIEYLMLIIKSNIQYLLNPIIIFHRKFPTLLRYSCLLLPQCRDLANEKLPALEFSHS